VLHVDYAPSGMPCDYASDGNDPHHAVIATWMVKAEVNTATFAFTYACEGHLSEAGHDMMSRWLAVQP
jgi:hypothetical protein